MADVTKTRNFKRALTVLAGMAATMAFASQAQAVCVQAAPSHVKSTLPPLSSYFEHEARLAAQSDCSHAATTLTHHSGQTVQTVAPSALSYSPAPLTPTVISGLGPNEGLRPTTCPVAVHNPHGGQVLGCYNVVRRVVRPVTHTTYYRVVRPIVYVRYPVPVPVCNVSPCGHGHHSHGGSRYGW